LEFGGLRNRLYTGWVHAQFHLPFKWYVGAYPELLRIVKIHLLRSGISEGVSHRVVEADDRLRDTVLERQIQVRGKLGNAFGRVHAPLVKLAAQADLLARGDLQHHSVLAIDRSSEPKFSAVL
jgi:hypothetical protein